jgi:hypothetical protein
MPGKAEIKLSLDLKEQTQKQQMNLDAKKPPQDPSRRHNRKKTTPRLPTKRTSQTERAKALANEDRHYSRSKDPDMHITNAGDAVINSDVTSHGMLDSKY